MTDDKAARWREERRAAAAAHGERLAERQRAESAQAQEQIDAFLRRALTDGPAPEPLSARSYDGRARYRTPLVGWYLRRDETVAVDTDGRFYVLTTPSSLTARLRGVTPEPSAPPLVIGAGGKDGESLDMAEALARVLAR
ncbi:hypothetical protein [Cellulomonas fengjieae]|uniref:hypothetical protein n=1 Tax=Cellulomonas fengjieae TaxID=2819978 RepID=UPI001AAFF43D|nr:hypothetical protein [Cellulomonas fengjieae]MBO3100347.1 hypothetical protein [Cellulomonas fengjieae]